MANVPESSTVMFYWSSKALLLLVIWTLLDMTGTAALTAPRFVQHPESQVIKQNSKAILHCMVVPDTADIQWTFNGNLLRSQPTDGLEVRNGRLTIQSFRHARHDNEVSHEGVYQCIANNSAGAIVSDEARLERAFLGQFAEADDVTVKATQGNTALIPCTPPRGKPQPLVTFERNGVTIDTSSRRHVVLPSGNLQISEVKQSDEGVYKCIGENPVSGQIRVSTPTVTLQVRSPTTNSAPQFVQKLKRKQEVVQGEDLILECVVQGSPVPVIVWDKHHGQLPHNRATQLLGNLVIRDIQLVDTGTYICRAENTVGVPTADFVNVDVVESPSIRVPPADQVAIDGFTVVFQCVARGRSVQTHWLYNTKPITSVGQYAISETQLTISRVSKENEGIYQCVARSRLGMTSSAALLQVKVQGEIDFSRPEVPDVNKDIDKDIASRHYTAPVITIAPSNASTTLGRTLILPCQATIQIAGFAEVTDHRTTRSSLLAFDLTPSPSSSLPSPKTTSELGLQPTTDSATDQYFYSSNSGDLQASNNETYNATTSTAEVTQPIAITWYHNGSLIKGLFLGDSGVWISRSDEELKQLRTQAEVIRFGNGQEAANINNNSDTGSDHLDGGKALRVGTVESSEDGVSGGLRIVEVQPEDSGLYTCVASNSAGLSYVSAYLHVLDPPTTTTGSPDMGRKKAELSPFPSSGPGSEDRSQRRNKNKNKRKNNRDEDRPSDNGDIYEYDDNVDNLVPPTTPEIKKLTDASVMVRWNVPENNGLDIVFFKIQYKEVSASSRSDRQWKTYDIDVPSTTHMHEVRKLKSTATYKFRVLAVYSNNDNRWSPTSRRFIMGQGGGPTPDGPVGRPRGSPVIVEVKPVNSDTLSVQWQYNIVDSSDIEGYYIYYKPFGSPNSYSRQEILGGNTHRYVLRNLRPETHYTINMKSYNDKGEGPVSNEVVKSTSDRIGGPVDNGPSFIPPEDDSYWLTTTPRSNLRGGMGGGRNSTTKSNQTLYMVLGIVLGVTLVCLLIVMLICWRKQKRDRRANNAQKNASIHKKEQQMNGGPHHFLLHNMNANSSNPPHTINGSLRNGRAGGSEGQMGNGTNHMSLTVNPFHGTLPRNGDSNKMIDGSERNYSPEDLEIQNLRRSLQELLHQPPAPPVPPQQDRNGLPVYYSNNASTVNINTRNQPNYYEVDPSHQDTLSRVHMATFGCPDCSTNRSRPQSRAESSLSNAPPPEYHSLGLRAQPNIFGTNNHSSTEIPDYSGSLHRQKPITNPYHMYNKDVGHSQYRNSPDHIPRSHERPPFRPHDVYSRSLRGPPEMNYPGYDTAAVQHRGVTLPQENNTPDIYEQVSDNQSVGSASGRHRTGSGSSSHRRRKQSPHRGSTSTPRSVGFVPVGLGGGGNPRIEPHLAERSVGLGHDPFPTSPALPAMPQSSRREELSSALPPRLPPRNLLPTNNNSTPPPPAPAEHFTNHNQFNPVLTGQHQSYPDGRRGSDGKESPQVIDDLSQDLPVLNGNCLEEEEEPNYGTGTDTAPPSSGDHGDLNNTTSDNLDSDLDVSDSEGNELNSPQLGLCEQEEMPLLVRPLLNNNNSTTGGPANGTGSRESTPLMQRNIPRANDYPSDDDNEEC